MKKKILLILLAVIIVTVVALCCYIAYQKLGVLDNSENTVTVEIAESEEDEIDDTPLFTEENYPKVDASLATQPLTNAFILDFVGKDIDVDKIEYTNTHPAYESLIQGDIDLIVVTEPSEDEKQLAENAGVELEVIPVVKEGFVFYVNSDNPVESLTIEQIQKIYTGEITNWKEVGGEDMEITAYQRPENSGSQTGMLSLVMKDLTIMQPKTGDLVDTMEQIINLVSNYENGKGAIGYSYYYYATTMYNDINSDIASGIKLLQINEVAPNDETIGNETYPLNTAYYIVIRADEKEDSLTRKLASAMLSKRGQRVAKEAGYVSVSE